MMNDANTLASARAIASKAAAASPYRLPRATLTKLLRFRRRSIVGITLVFADFIATLVSLSIVDLLTDGSRPAVHSDTSLVSLLIFTNFALGLYAACGPSPYERFRHRAFGVLLFVAASLLLAGVVTLGVRAIAIASFGGTVLLLVGYYAETVVRQILIHLRLWGAPAVLVGLEEPTKELARRLLAEPELGLRPAGFLLSVNEVARDGGSTLPLPVVGTVMDTTRVGADVEVAIFSSPDHLVAYNKARRGRSSFAQVILVENALEMQSLWLRTRTLGAAVGIEIRRDLFRKRNLWVKRAIDLAIAIPVGLMALPVIAILALAIKAVDPGSAFYVQSRVGRDGRPLRVFKLRSMYHDAERRLDDHLRENPHAREEWQRYFKLTNDPRVLPVVGKFIRRASLDELPQLWNIIRGDMSLVGPRPFPPYHTDSFDREFQTIRASVPPGLTGFWQIASRSAGDLEVQKTQDLFYIRNWSILLDFYIILQTLPAVLGAKGAK